MSTKGFVVESGFPQEIALSSGNLIGRPSRRQHGVIWPVYARYGLTVQDLTVGMSSVGESRQSALHRMARVTCAESTSSITTHCLRRGCIQHAILDCVTRVAREAYCTLMR